MKNDQKAMFPKFFLTIPAKIFMSNKLTTSDKLVFEVIYTMTSVVGNVHMADAALARYVGLSTTTVKRSIKHLKQLNLIGGE